MLQFFLLGVMTFLLSSCAFYATGLKLGMSQETKVDPMEASKIHVALGIVYLQDHHISRAKDELRLALAQSPQSSEVWYALGYFYEVTHQEPLARQAYQKAIILNPHSGAAHNNYGVFLCQRGQFKAAIKQFMLAIQQPDYLQTAKAYENAGYCALSLHDKKAASRYFHQASFYEPHADVLYHHVNSG